MLKESAIDESIKSILIPIIESLKVKDAEIIELKNEVTYLIKKVNEMEQYSIFRNLPLLSGRSITEDVVTFINKQLGVQMGPKDLVACHAVAPVRNPAQPPAIIAKFIYFSLKDRVWGRKTSLRFLKNPLNGYAVYLTERLTKRDQKLVNEANNMGIHVPTNNCKPKVWKNCGDGQFMKQTLVDRDDLLELARSQKLRNIRKRNS